MNYSAHDESAQRLGLKAPLETQLNAPCRPNEPQNSSHLQAQSGIRYVWHLQTHNNVHLKNTVTYIIMLCVFMQRALRIGMEMGGGLCAREGGAEKEEEREKKR